MAIYQVVVGNIGTVYEGGAYDSANDAFHVYREQSINGAGRAYGEPVTLLADRNILKEYLPPSESEE